MKTVIILFIALAATALAKPPRVVPTTKYTRLWTDSPFTTKPPPPPPPEVANPLEDYALGGISPIPGGYRVTLLNRKNPEERIILPENQDFKVLSVQYAPGNPLGTTVRVSTGSKSGTVAFDEKLLTLKAAPAPPPPQQGQPPQPVPGQPAAAPGTEPPRAPRPRVVPPAGPGNQPAANQGSGTLPPGVAPNTQQGTSQPNQRIQRR
ncbi:hypothetical protein OVA24_19795 [Luteolibacter sp. SL250]|uniref:hypothetical protein n=1 Tax=Luteolibacter sp. SL250 TaxID=2995170 RepID=UPI0022718EF9|nr:hypothetical protein [Luteolibacter sp. SL250]WAC19471.1 hypothetical protein OVA24_19795 [Luteolibacter sp. SL250]